MPRLRLVLLTLLAMLAFAGNSLLCRAAFTGSRIDPASFTSIRIVSGAIALGLIVRGRGSMGEPAGNWVSAAALVAYALAFSFAYQSLTAATGALLLFGAVQATMIGVGLIRGERLHGLQILGVVCAVAGLVGLLLPGLAAPPLLGSALMLTAGTAWGLYSLRGKGQGDPLRMSAGNFIRATIFALSASVVAWPWASVDARGLVLAIASGAITSGLGYAVWYTVLPQLKVTTAATVQLSAPVLAALGGIWLLGEAPTWRLMMASLAILGGIGLVVKGHRRLAPRPGRQ